MIRFGMNKKSTDPINDSNPFYYVENGTYIPASNIFVNGPSRSFYRPKAEGLNKIVWMETNSKIYPLSEIDDNKKKSFIHIDKIKVIEQLDCPCCIDNNIYCNEFEIMGPCALLYDINSSPSIRIVAMGNVNVLS